MSAHTADRARANTGPHRADAGDAKENWEVSVSPQKAREGEERKQRLVNIRD